MRLIVGAPVAFRDWALPYWFERLAAQTRRPDGFVFVHSGPVDDATWRELYAGAARHSLPVPTVIHDDAWPHTRHDNARFETLARLRNRLLATVCDTDTDLLLSLDTDIMLEDPRTIERLEELVLAGSADIAQPVAFLHPQAPAVWQPGDEVCWAYNFGWLQPYAPSRMALRRPHVDSLAWGETLAIDVPMACWLGNRAAMACRYAPHESGEDIGFAQDLQAAGVHAVADTSLYAFHAWDERHLASQLAVAQ